MRSLHRLLLGGRRRAALPPATVPPVNTGVLPSFSGPLTEGQVIAADRGGWEPRPLTADAWQHQVSNDGSTGWANIVGATDSTLALGPAQTGKYVRAGARPSNAAGQAAALVYGAAYGPIAAVLQLSGAAPDGTVGAAYDWQPVVTGGHGPFGWSATSLPTGASIDPATGEVSSAALTEEGIFSGIVTVVDSDGLTTFLAFNITVAPAAETGGAIDFSDPDAEGGLVLGIGAGVI